MGSLKLRGLDDFSPKELELFWKDYQPGVSSAKILGVSISCSNRCNLKCIYCYAGNERKREGELDLNEQKQILSQAAELGAKTVVICGDGEPSIDPNLPQIVMHAKTLGLSTIVVSNGVIFGDDNQCQKVHNMPGLDFLKLLYENNASLIIKLESINQDRYEEIVGVSGTFEKFMRGIDRMVECGYGNLNNTEVGAVTRFAFSSVIMKNNIEELPTLKSFADSRNAQFICKLPSLVGSALKNIDNMFEVSEYEVIRKQLFDYTAKRETLMVDTPRCMAWHYGPCIDIKGEIRECYTSAYTPDKRVGNIRETSLKELIEKKNTSCDLLCNDFCPVKSRINKEFEKKGMKKIWNQKEDGVNVCEKILGF